MCVCVCVCAEEELVLGLHRFRYVISVTDGEAGNPLTLLMPPKNNTDSIHTSRTDCWSTEKE